MEVLTQMTPMEAGFNVPRSEHKPGCLGDKPGCFHRIPIDCVTREDLENAIGKLRGEVSSLKGETERLKAKLYDIEHKGE